jgi:hypothetical protein
MNESDKSGEIVNLGKHRLEKDKEHYAKLDRASALVSALEDFFRNGGTLDELHAIVAHAARMKLESPREE